MMGLGGAGDLTGAMVVAIAWLAACSTGQIGPASEGDPRHDAGAAGHPPIDAWATPLQDATTGEADGLPSEPHPPGDPEPTAHPSCGQNPQTLVGAEPLGSWSCAIFPYQTDVWMLTSRQGQGLFDYRFGGAGAIAEMRDVQAGYSHLLAQSFQGEMTDRVIQWVAWDLGLLNPLPGFDQEYQWRFNVTQAGNVKGAFNGTVSVHADPERCLVDIYSVPHRQWFPQQDPHFATRFSALTRYQLAAHGNLHVHRVILTSPLAFKGIATNFQQLLFEAWTPFRVGPFDAAVQRFKGDGGLLAWQVFPDLTGYPWLPAHQSSGYVAVVKTPGHAQSPAVGLVYGTKQPCRWSGGACDGAAGGYFYNQMQWNGSNDKGMALIPGWRFDQPLGPGLVLEQHLYLAPARGADASFVQQLEQRAASVPAPRLLTRSDALETELCPIVERLEQNLSATGAPTEHLESLLQ
jgi:hypothetical protein